jgi:hypothetical protein
VTFLKIKKLQNSLQGHFGKFKMTAALCGDVFYRQKFRCKLQEPFQKLKSGCYSLQGGI